MIQINGLRAPVRPLERGYHDIHAQLLDARREAVELRKQVKRLERVIREEV